MINLIKNELIKISKKKSIYITLLVTLAFVIITNIIYNIEPNYNYDLGDQIKFYEEQLKQLEINDPQNVEEYVSCKVELEINKLIQNCGGTHTWKAKIIEEQGYELIYAMENSKYITKSDEEYKKASEEYNRFIARLDANDWKYFAEENLKDIEEEIKEQSTLKANSNSKEEALNIENQIQELEDQRQVVRWRLEKDICYGYDYYNQCLNHYQNAKITIRSYDESSQNGLTEEEKYQLKQSYYDALEEEAVSKYDIEHEAHTGDTSTAKGILLNMFTEYEIFIIIMAVMIAGTIVSEEFNKGTVKLLLIKPYSRTKILTAKFITSLIILIIVIILVALMQFIVGGFVQGFDNYNEAATVYNHTNNELQELSIIKYLAIQAVGKLPIYILLLTLAFALSTLFTNSALAIAITLLGSMSASTINMLALNFKFTWIKFFVTPNWDLTQYFFGKLPQFMGLTAGFSMAIILIYMIIMLVPTYIVFKKKNIKNI